MMIATIFSRCKKVFYKKYKCNSSVSSAKISPLLCSGPLFSTTTTHRSLTSLGWMVTVHPEKLQHNMFTSCWLDLMLHLLLCLRITRFDPNPPRHCMALRLERGIPGHRAPAGEQGTAPVQPTHCICAKSTRAARPRCRRRGSLGRCIGAGERFCLQTSSSPGVNAEKHS